MTREEWTWTLQGSIAGLVAGLGWLCTTLLFTGAIYGVQGVDETFIGFVQTGAIGGLVATFWLLK